MKIGRLLRNFTLATTSLLICGWLWSAAEAARSSYYVAVSGSDNYSCPQAQNSVTPKRTINAGLKCLQGGDTLIIREGTYRENVRNAIPSGRSWEEATTIKSEPPRQVILKPSGKIPLEITNDGAKYIVVDGLVLDAIDARGFRGLQIGAQNQSPPVTNIRIQNAIVRNSYDVASCVGTAYGSSKVDLIDSIVHTCRYSGTPNELGIHGLYWHSSYSTIKGNEIYNTQGLGMQIYDAKGRSFSDVEVLSNYIHDTGGVERAHPGILLGHVNNALIANNIISKTGRLGVDTGSGSNVRIYNNTIYSVEKGIRVKGDKVAIKNNIITGTDTPISREEGSTLESKNLTSNPKFVDPQGGNFRLQSDSPAIDAGVTLSDISDDFEGARRPQGEAFDIGAYELRKLLTSPSNLRLTSR